MHQHAQHLLRYLVHSLNGTLLHWAPWSPEPVPKAQQGRELLHQEVLELRPAVAPQQPRQSAGPEHTARKSPPNLTMRQILHRLK